MRIPRFRFAVLAAAGVASACVRARAAEFEYKLGTVLAVEHPTTIRLTQMFKDIREETRGRFEGRVYPNSQLGSEGSQISQLRIGAIQFFMIGSSVSTLVPLVNLIGVPFLFESTAQAFAAFDGDLGAFMMKEFPSKGLYVFPTVWDLGMRHITTSVRPVRTPEDLAGLKLRIASSKINEEFLRAFGASPVPVSAAETYSALQTHLVDGAETALAVIEGSRWVEVQKYLSLTNDSWSNLWFLANPQAINALPPDIRASLERNAHKYGLLERRDSTTLNAALEDKLHREGLTVNRVNNAPFRRRLAGQYRAWKADFGPQAWDLLEKYAGKLT